MKPKWITVGTFICECCGGTFEKGWSEASADAEYHERFGAMVLLPEERAIVCDDCYKKIMAFREQEMN